MNNNVRTVVQDKANPGVETATKWVATSEEISQHLPTLTKGQQVCVLAHARYQKIPDVAKESGYSVHSIRQWLKTEATFYACWHGMGRHVLENGREMALNLARTDAPRAVLALQEIGSIPTYDSETGMLRPQALGSVVRANETMLKVAGCCVVVPAVAGAVAIFGFRGGDKDGKSDRNIQEVTGDAQDAKKQT